MENINKICETSIELSALLVLSHKDENQKLTEENLRLLHNDLNDLNVLCEQISPQDLPHVRSKIKRQSIWIMTCGPTVQA